MAYLTSQEYKNIIYSQDSRHKIKIWFDNVELENADNYCESLSRDSRCLPNDGKKVFSLSNFMQTSITLILHEVDKSLIKGQVKIAIGTLVNEETEEYEYIPLGVFNIANNPITDKKKTTIELVDNRSKFDFNYNAKPLFDLNNGKATKKQILDDICTQSGVENLVTAFDGQDNEIGIYDNTIKAYTYVSYIAEQCGAKPIINRDGKLDFIYLNNLATHKIPVSILETGFQIGDKFSIKRVVYESGTIKFETSNDETLDTLFLNSANPYINRQEQIDSIYNIVKDFTIDSFIGKRVLGNPAIDCYDIIEIYDDTVEDNPILIRTLANTLFTYNGVCREVFTTEIGKEERKENVTINTPSTLKKWAKTEIDNVEGKITSVVGTVDEQNTKISTIEQTTNSISASVKELNGDVENVSGKLELKIDKGNTDEVVSAFNLAVNKVKIKSDGFELDEIGNLTCYGALLRGGNIKLQDNGTPNGASIQIETLSVYTSNITNGANLSNKKIYLSFSTTSTFPDDGEFVDEGSLIKYIKLIETSSNNYEVYLRLYKTNTYKYYTVDVLKENMNFEQLYGLMILNDGTKKERGLQKEYQFPSNVGIVTNINSLPITRNIKLSNSVTRTTSYSGYGIEADIISDFDYTQSDLNYVKNKLNTGGTFTQEDMLRYDTDKNGVINTIDLLRISKYVNSGITSEKSGKFKLDTHAIQDNIQILDGNNNEKVSIGLDGISVEEVPLNPYKKGEQINFDGIIVNGLVTTGTTEIMINIVTPYLLNNIDNITCDIFNVELRGTNGYINNTSGYIEYVGKSGYSFTCSKVSENMIFLELKKSSAYTNVSNNTPIVVRGKISLSLN